MDRRAGLDTRRAIFSLPTSLVTAFANGRREPERASLCSRVATEVQLRMVDLNLVRTV